MIYGNRMRKTSSWYPWIFLQEAVLAEEASISECHRPFSAADLGVHSVSRFLPRLMCGHLRGLIMNQSRWKWL